MDDGARELATEWRTQAMRRLSPLTVALLASGLLAGCAVGPNYHRPAIQTPPAYRDPGENAQAQAASFADLPWWQIFQDPQLQDLIRTALKQNYDLRLATERINSGARPTGNYALQSFPSSSSRWQLSAAEGNTTFKPSQTF